MVRNFKCKLTNRELKYYQGCFVKLEQCDICNRISLFGLNLPQDPILHFTKGGISKTSKDFLYNEIVINNKAVKLSISDCRDNTFEKSVSEFLQFLRDSESRRKSILKLQEEGETLNKSINLDDVVVVKDISPIFNDLNNKSDEKDIQINGKCAEHETNGFLSSSVTCGKSFKCSQFKTNQNLQNSCFHCKKFNVLHNSKQNSQLEKNRTWKTKKTSHFKFEESVNFLKSADSSSGQSKKKKYFKGFANSFKTEMNVEISTPKRKRGRPRKNNPDPPFNPSAPKRKSYAIVKKVTQPVLTESGEKRKRGRPRKRFVFGFQSVVSDIKTIELPSDLWSAHVSVSSKKSQVCFTRVVQAVSSSVPVECDRSVKFNGSIDYLAQINNRDVLLTGAPKKVDNLKDIEVLLQIVHDIDINDPVLQYLQR